MNPCSKCGIENGHEVECPNGAYRQSHQVINSVRDEIARLTLSANTKANDLRATGKDWELEYEFARGLNEALNIIHKHTSSQFEPKFKPGDRVKIIVGHGTTSFYNGCIATVSDYPTSNFNGTWVRPDGQIGTTVSNWFPNECLERYDPRSELRKWIWDTHPDYEPFVDTRLKLDELIDAVIAEVKR